jgi:hypothetical protein
VLVVGDETTLKVHVHTDEPELATAVFADAGDVSRLDVADMRQQMAMREARLAGAASAGGAPASGNGAVLVNGGAPANGDAGTRLGGHGEPGEAVQARCGAVAVVSGEGLAEMFRELGVHTIDGGSTLNPSTYDLLAGIHEVPAEEVIVLPNSANVIMAAENAAKLSDKQVLVVPATSQQAGLAAALALLPERTLEENGLALRQALDGVRTGAVAPAARDDGQGRFKRGEAVGFVEDEVLAWGDPGETLRAVLSALSEPARGTVIAGESAGAGPASGTVLAAPELISVLAGEGAPLGLSEVEQLAGAGVELELRQGGQPAYWWLLAAE